MLLHSLFIFVVLLVLPVPLPSIGLKGDTMKLKYTTIPLHELMQAVESRPVQLQMPFSTPLRNSYYGLRHGQSTANVEGIISSDPVVGSLRHGLTDLGRTQARNAALPLIKLIGKEAFAKNGVVFLTSNFTRARETAYECYDEIKTILGLLPTTSAVIDIKNNLRERYFGKLDAQDLLFYNRVWPIDSEDGNNERDGVESVRAVCERIAGLVKQLEAQHSSKHIVFTSHADTLQITQMLLAGKDARKFYLYRLGNGEVRDMSTLLAPPVEIIYK